MDRIRRFDERTGGWILSWPDRWQPLFAGVSFLGEPWVVGAIALSGFASAASRGQSNVERAFILAGIAYGINTIIKLLLRRRRPHNLQISTLGINSYSFPSGHAFGTMLFYGLYAYLDYRYLSSPINLIIAAALFLLTLSIGISRVRLGIHYPTDVLGGWLLGGLGLLIILWLLFW
jgi:undecaprenyl-diphosphatase